MAATPRSMAVFGATIDQRRDGERSAAPNGKRRQTGEADLSTEQAGAQAPSLFPRAHGDQGWSQGALETARAGPQAAQRLRRPPGALAWNDCGSAPISWPPPKEPRWRQRH